MEVKDIVLIVIILAAIYYLKIYQPTLFNSADGVLSGLFRPIFEAIGGFIQSKAVTNATIVP